MIKVFNVLLVLVLLAFIIRDVKRYMKIGDKCYLLVATSTVFWLILFVMSIRW